MIEIAIAAIIVALIFDFVNGFNDSANSVATVIGTRVLKPLHAVALSAAANFVGPFVFGVAVATTIAKELVKATKEVELMTSKLQNMKDPSTMIEHCRKTSEIEHKIDDLYKLSMTELFESTDAIQIIKLKDIYESMETASDRCVDVADVVEDIVLKYT